MSANGAYQQQSSTSIVLSIPHIAKYKQYGYFFFPLNTKLLTVLLRNTSESNPKQLQSALEKSKNDLSLKKES